MADATLYPAAMPKTDGFGTNMAIIQAPAFPLPNHMTFDAPRVSPLTMIAMRMKWGSYSGAPIGVVSDPPFMPFQFIDAVHAADNKIYVFVLTRGNKPVTLEDDGPLFPSDQLITQLRLLEQNGVQP